MSEEDVIRLACYRAGSDHAGRTSAALAAAIVAPTALQPYAGADILAPFLAAVAAEAGSDVLDLAGRLAPAWSYGEWVSRLSGALQSGSLSSVQMLLSGMPGAVRAALTGPELAAVAVVVAARTLRLIDVVAAEMGAEAPGEVTAADVDAALGR